MLETSTKSKIGSPIPAGGNEGIVSAAGTVSERDLKMLSLEFIGRIGEDYYFRNPHQPDRLFRGTVADLNELVDVRERHPLIDAETAAAMRSMGERVCTPFGTLDGDVIGS